MPEMAGLDEGTPLFTQIAERLAAEIADGGLAEGERVPSTNELAAFYRINLVAAWRETTVFTEAERAALALAEEGTRLADASTGVSDETWAQVRKHYDDDQIAALVALVAMVNAANRMGVIVRQQGGSYQPGLFDHLAS